MPCIFLCENNSLSKKALSLPFSALNISLFEVPFKKMRKKHIRSFRERLSKSDALFLSEPALNSLLPETDIDYKAFFHSTIIKFLYATAKEKNLFSNRLVISAPTEELSLSALNFFKDIAFLGDDALSVSNKIFEMTGAPIPIVSGTKASDILLCAKNHINSPSVFTACYDIPSGENSLGQDGMLFYPKGEYANLTSYTKRPLTLKEAARLSEYDKKASFNIAF